MRLFGVKLPPALDAAGKACLEHLRLAAALSALINLLYLAPTIYMMQVYDRVVPTGGAITLVWLTLVIAFALATLAMLDALRARVMLRAGFRLDRLLAPAILDRVLRRDRADGVAPQVMRDFDNLRQALSGPPAMALFDIPWTLVYILVSFALHPLLGVVSVVASLVLLGMAILNERATHSGTRSALRSLALAYAAHERLASQAELIRGLGMRGAIVQRQVDERRRGLALASDYQFVAGRYSAMIKFLRLFLQSFALGIGAWLAINDRISYGSIIAASVLINRALQPIDGLVGSWNSIQQSRQAIESISAMFSYTDEVGTDRFELPPPQGAVHLHQVTVLRPAGGPPLLVNASIDVKPNELIGIIGPSGAGKSTLARVLAGVLLPDHGAVRLDGADMQDWESERLARHIGYMPQDCMLLPGTIAENISRFALADGEDRKKVTEMVLEAASLAGVHEMVLGLSGGYDLRVEWNGAGLSVGQRQRIALARALYGSPSILILDEPNAALDSEGEAALLRAIETMRGNGATIFVVAHRPSMLVGASRLIAMANGRVDLCGSRDEVMTTLKSRASGSNLIEMKAG